MIGRPKASGLDRLRLLAVLLAAGAVGAFEFLRHQRLAHVFPGPPAESSTRVPPT